MVKRKKIAINFFTDYKQATGLSIYLINIIRALCCLPDEQKPTIFILHTESAPVDHIKELNYPYIEFFLNMRVNKKISFTQRLINKFFRTFGLKMIFEREGFEKPFPLDIALIYPYFYQPETEYIKEKVYWKADFQEKYYPSFFPQSDLDWSAKFLSDVSQKKDVMVLSSYDALKDYKKFYPEYKNEIKLLRFASQLPKFDHVSIEEVKRKYDINNQFFLIANQFWPHKNHITVLKAINRVKDRLNCVFVFTGNTTSHRDVSYYPTLLKYINENGIQDLVKFTGFIDRLEQLQLMMHSIALIQPSLFEGWSTVIEDGKALNKFVIASDLGVNMEQIKVNAAFFEAENDFMLSQLILVGNNGELKTIETDYQPTLSEFQKDVLNVLNI